MLGCGLRPNTAMHALEECVENPLFLGNSLLFTLKDWDGASLRRRYKVHAFDALGLEQRYDRVADLPDAAFVRRGKVLAADTCVLETLPLREAVMKAMRRDPFFFVQK